MTRLGAHASLWTPAWTRQAAEVVIPEAARRGFGIIEINPYDFEDEAAIDASRSLFEQHGIQPVCSIGLPPELGAPLRPAEAASFVNTAMDRALRVGASLTTGLTYGTLGYRSGNPPLEAEYKDIVTLLKPIARRVASSGLTIGIEICNRYETHLLNTGEQGVMLQEMIGEPNVTVHLDTYHMNIEEKGFAAGFQSVKGKCAYVHLSESHRGVPGTGTIDWNDVFAGLAAVGFQGDLTLESFINVPEVFKAVLAVWRPVAPSSEAILGGLPYLFEIAGKHGIQFEGVK